MKKIIFIVLAVCFSGNLFADDDPCLPLVNGELARLGYGSINPNSGCINKETTTGDFGKTTLKVTPLKNPPSVVYDKNAKMLTVNMGKDEITGDALSYDLYFTNDCKYIAHAVFYGDLGPGVSLQADRAKCKDAMAGKFESDDYAERQWNEKLKKICKFYELKLGSNPSGGPTGSIKSNKGNSKDRAM